MIMKIIRIISRLIVGIIFIFSGFVKAIDPLGTAYKFSDYFEAFHMEFLGSLSLVLSILLSLSELIIGISLLLGLRMKITSWFLLIFMSGFTLITLKLAISNPVTDCGCFGDAIILTNWQTFKKNIIILVPTIFIFIQRDNYIPFYSATKEWILEFIFLCGIVTFALFNYNNLPMIDFRPYKIGTNISEAMTIPDGSPKDEYKFSFIYEKNGKKKEFSIENIPDSTWNWVETKQELLQKGYVPPIHDFSITTLGGTDITRDVLNDTNYVMLMVAYDLKKADKNSMLRLSDLTGDLSELNCKVIGITSSTFDIIDNFLTMHKPAYQICTADIITLKTIVRSNPGMVLLKKGKIINKWHYRNFPKEIKENLLAFSLNQMRWNRSMLMVLITGLIFILVAVIYHLINRE